MRRLVLTSVLAGMTLHLAAQDEDPLATLSNRPIQGKIEREEVKSRVLGKKVPYVVYLPPAYRKEPERQFPLVLFLHDLLEPVDHWVDRAAPQMFEDEMKAGTLPPFVWAAPEGRKGFWVDGARRQDRLETFLMEDFLPHIDKNYRLASKARYVVGHGVGGFGALSLAFGHPSIFAGVAAHRPWVLPRDPADFTASQRQFLAHPFLAPAAERVFSRPIDTARWSNVHPLTRADDLPEGWRGRVDIGGSAGDTLGVNVHLESLRQKLQKGNIGHRYEVHPGATDGWTYLREYLPETLRFLLVDPKPQKERSG